MNNSESIVMLLAPKEAEGDLNMFPEDKKLPFVYLCILYNIRFLCFRIFKRKKIEVSNYLSLETKRTKQRKGATSDPRIIYQIFWMKFRLKNQKDPLFLSPYWQQH